MTNNEILLKYAKENFSIGDKISRKKFYTNKEEITISGEEEHHLYNNSIYLGVNEIYCGVNKVWAVNLSKPNIEEGKWYKNLGTKKENMDIIPEYVKCIKWDQGSPTGSHLVGIIYKITNGCVELNPAYKSGTPTKYSYFKSNFIASTKEEYDKQEFEALGLSFADKPIIKEKVDRNLLIKIEKDEVDKVFEYLIKQGERIGKDAFSYNNNWSYIGFYNSDKKWTIARDCSSFGTNIILAKDFLKESESTLPVDDFQIGDLVEVKQNITLGSDAEKLIGKRFIITAFGEGEGVYGKYVLGYKEQHDYKRLFPLHEGGIYCKDLKLITPKFSNIKTNDVDLSSFLGFPSFPSAPSRFSYFCKKGKSITIKRPTRKVILLPLIEVKKRIII